MNASSKNNKLIVNYIFRYIKALLAKNKAIKKELEDKLE